MPVIELFPSVFDKYAERDGSGTKSWKTGTTDIVGTYKALDDAVGYTIDLLPLHARGYIKIESAKVKLFLHEFDFNETIIRGPGAGNLVNHTNYPNTSTGAFNFLRDAMRIDAFPYVFTFTDFTNSVPAPPSSAYYDYNFNATGLADLRNAHRGGQSHYSLACSRTPTGDDGLQCSPDSFTGTNKPILEVIYTPLDFGRHRTYIPGVDVRRLKLIEPGRGAPV